MNLGSIIDGHDDDRVAVLSRGRPTTYGVLRRQVGGLRAGLTDLGLSRGDRVAIIASNNRYFVVGYLAVVGAGMVAVPIDPTTPALAVKEELDAVQARALIAGPSARALVTANTEGALDGVEFIIGCGFTPEGGTTFEKLIESEPTDRVELDGDAPAVLAFTSGTAGSPKPAILSHAALSVNIEQQKASAADRVRADDVTLGVAPLSHIMGLNSVLSSSLSVGASTLLIERFDPVLALESMQKHGVTVAVGPPTMWSSWLNLPDLPADVFASIRIAVSGAARLPEKVSKAFEERFGVRLWEGYGLTEAAPVVCSSYGTDAPHGSVGIPVPGLEVRLVDRDGDDVLIGHMAMIHGTVIEDKGFVGFAAQRNFHVGKGHGAVGLGHKVFTAHLAQQLQHTTVVHLPRANLLLNHVVARQFNRVVGVAVGRVQGNAHRGLPVIRGRFTTNP